ncbi:hypothetical protein [Arthrobacter sp. 08Y14]|uniref:hypothetical protein n=1 Tax=Arthrobacter sp. 08Y14 TaxID=2058885 RepID=UPI000CE34EFF|nr:hypothetical protein [Arthrobacter sp. 08Y14]
MKNTMKAGALLLAGMLALSACGSSDEPASASDSEAASASPSPTATLAVGQEQYTADELLAAIEAVNAAQGGTGEVSDDATFRQYLTDQSLPEGITAKPAECEGIAGFANFFGDVDQANLASVKLGSDQKLTVVSHPEASALDAQMQDNDGLLGECAEFEMGDEEFTAAGTTERLDVSTGAPQTQAFSLTMTAEGTTLSGLKVSAATGTTNIVVTNSNAADPEEASAQAAELIDAVLAELEK